MIHACIIHVALDNVYSIILVSYVTLMVSFHYQKVQLCLT